jgi:hypothetical protein
MKRNPPRYLHIILAMSAVPQNNMLQLFIWICSIFFINWSKTDWILYSNLRIIFLKEPAFWLSVFDGLFSNSINICNKEWYPNLFEFCSRFLHECHQFPITLERIKTPTLADFSLSFTPRIPQVFLFAIWIIYSFNWAYTKETAITA